MSEKKVLNINPELFSFSNNKTRKKKEKKENDDKIKVKSSSVVKDKTKDKTLKKRSILKMIREQQQKNYDSLFDKPKIKEKSSFDNEFQKATSYLDDLVKNKHQISPNHSVKNTTIKQKPSITTTPIIQAPIQTTGQLVFPEAENVNIEFPTENQPALQLKPMISSHTPTPQYGCLKNGSLPTYRSFMNKTVKNMGGENPQSNIENKIWDKEKEAREQIRDLSLRNQQKEMNKMLLPKKVKRPTKRRKTIKRTYNIGRSKTKPNIGVLISNKTIRNRISTQKQLLKQHSIPDIKRYLVKHGFIKVGSATPNDVLRKMYETATLVCGEIVNHNPDNLLFNFMNSKE
jgi:hypothetical protein